MKFLPQTLLFSFALAGLFCRVNAAEIATPTAPPTPLSTTPAAPGSAPASAPTPAAQGWRGMFRDLQTLRRASPLPPELTKNFPGFSDDMARLGEAFARAAYPKDAALGRRNFLTLVKNLEMEKPGPADLRQFLHPNKKPWAEYAGPTDGNFHMLFNTGTLNLDTSDGSSKTHPAAKLARKHLSFFTTQARVKALTRLLADTIRATKTDTAATAADPARRAAFLERCKAAWTTRTPGGRLTEGELSFLAAMLTFTA